MKKAVIYSRKGRLFFRTCSQTTAGVWIDEGVCLSLPSDAVNEDIGQALLKALEASRTNILHPASWNHLNDELLSAAGVKSWSTFGKSAKCLNVEQSQVLRVIPTKNFGSQGGFQSQDELAQVFQIPADAFSLGEGVAMALSQSE